MTDIAYLHDMAQRYYFDTSVFGGVFDPEFEEETLQLFEKVKLGEIICVYSDLTERELSNAPQRVQDYFNQLDRKYMERIEVSEEGFTLGRTYVDEKVVGPTSFDDCVHITTATLGKVDILVSWNFKHIVNIFRIRGYNSVNLRLGHRTLEIRSPKNIVGYENEG
jgi:predicted nucleic acid-binding protein